MKKTLILFLLIPVFVNAQQVFDFSDSAVEQRLRKDLYFMASDSLKGREAGTANEIIARDYIINEFKQAGLAPYYTNDSDYIQEFEFKNNYWDEEQNSLTINETEYSLWTDFYPLAYSGEGFVKGSAEYVGMGIADSIDFSKSNSKGKIIFMDDEVPSAYKNSQIYSVENRIQSIEKSGASAIIIVAGSDYFSFYNSKINCSVPVFIMDNAAFEKIDLTKNVGVALQLTRQSDYKIYNVVGCINNNAASTIIIGAHYDHLGARKDGITGNLKIYNGADDNASGTVAVIELARYMKQEGSKNYNYILCAFSGEEKGLLGSESFVKSVFFNSYNTSEIKFMLDFDMVGRLGAFGNVLYVNGVGSSKQWKKIIRKNPPDDFIIKKVPDGMNGSDDYPFYKKGVPVLFFITGLHSEYHTPADDAEKINYSGEVKIINYAKKLILNVTPDAKLKYRKVNFWQTCRSYIIYAKMFL
ncbi:MAG: M28 family peptidase [Bacteroidota bacterium]